MIPDGLEQAIKTTIEGQTHPDMYLITLQGNFTKSSAQNRIASKISFSVLADGSKVWAIVAYDKGDNAVWQENELAVPEAPGKKLSYSDVVFAIPNNLQVNDPTNPRMIQAALSGPHAIAVKTGESCTLIAGDSSGTNLWTVAKDPRPILDTAGKTEFYNTVYKWNENKGENKIMPVWATNPHALGNGRQLAFESNRGAFTW